MKLRLREVLARPRPADPAPPRSLIGQTGLVTAGTFVQGLARFAYPVLIGNVMPAGTVGKVQSAISMAMVLSLLWPTSAANAASKYIGSARGAGEPQAASQATRYLIRTMAKAALALIMLALLVGWGVIGLSGGMLVSAPLLVLAYAGYIFVRGIQFGSGRAAGAAILDMATSVVTLGLLTFVLAGQLSWPLLLPLTTGYGIYTVLAWPKLDGKSEVPAPKRRELEIASFVRWGALSSLAAGGVQQLTMLLTNLVDTKEMVDQYAAAITVATPAAMLVGALYQVLFPSVTSSHSAGEERAVKARVDAATRALVVTLTALLGMVSVAAGPIVDVLYPGKAWPSAAGLLSILAIAVLLANLGAPSVIFLAGTTGYGMRLVATFNVCALAIAIGVGWALSVASGAYGLAIGAAVGGFVVSAGPIVTTWRRAQMRWRGLTLRFGAGFIAIVALAVIDARWDLGWWRLLEAVGFALGWLGLATADLRVVARVSPLVSRVLPWLAKEPRRAVGNNLAENAPSCPDGSHDRSDGRRRSGADGTE